VLNSRLFLTAAAALLIAGGSLSPAHAQKAGGSPGYFMPPSASSAPAHVVAPAHRAAPGSEAPTVAAGQEGMPPIPQLPALPKGAAPPVPVIGVLSVPEVMQKSTAAQDVQKVVSERRQTLAAAAQKEQAGWQKEQAGINAERSKLTDAQLEAKEKALQNEIAVAQSKFRQQDDAIQGSAQEALGKIESTLIAVIRQVAESRGMNLVLHREQVALNVNAFDITQQVADELNKLMPSVSVPPADAAAARAAEAAAENGQANQ
jgi:Skp family chaperone for outer membrane proteins